MAIWRNLELSTLAKLLVYEAKLAAVERRERPARGARKAEAEKLELHPSIEHCHGGSWLVVDQRSIRH